MHCFTINGTKAAIGNWPYGLMLTVLCCVCIGGNWGLMGGTGGMGRLGGFVWNTNDK